MTVPQYFSFFCKFSVNRNKPTENNGILQYF